MKIAVIEHRLLGDVGEDARSLAEASNEAARNGAEVVFFPGVLPVEETEAHARLAELVSAVPGTRLIPRVSEADRGQVFSATDEIPVVGSRLGSTALMHGDSCFDADALARIAAQSPSVLVMTPMSENDLQAEAVLELGLQLSESVAGLIVIAEAAGAEPGEPGHGGSAIILLGKILAESIGQEGEVLFAEVPEPIPSPEPPEPLPEVPTILAQRLATHGGRKLDMGYLADLSDGMPTG